MKRLLLYGAGSNSQGQLGIGTLEDAHEFTQCELDTPVLAHDESELEVRMCAGASHTLLLIRRLTDDGKISDTSLYVAGASPRGQLGVIDGQSLQDGRGGIFKPSRRLSFQLVDVSAFLRHFHHNHHIDALLLHGHTWTVFDVAAGWESSLFLLIDADDPAHVHNRVLLACGSNDHAQLGCDDTHAQFNVIQFPPEETVRAVFSGPRHSLAIVGEDWLYGWGASRNCQLGPSISQKLTFRPTIIKDLGEKGQMSGARVALGNAHTIFAMSETPPVYAQCVGDNSKFQLGPVEPETRSQVMTQIPSKSNITGTVTPYANWKSSFLLLELGTESQLRSWGNNANGQLGWFEPGAPSLPPTSFGIMGAVNFKHKSISDGPNAKIAQVAAGSEHTLALLEARQGGPESRQVCGWGWNEHGNLGRGEDVSDVVQAVKLEVPKPANAQFHSVHAGNATSWVAVLVDEP